jgi:redox-sensitive bicupin YhaK (pirin superfamily)
MAKTVFHAAGERGHADHGWLNAHHSFSFASYHDPSKIHFGVLRVLNDDIVAAGMGFGKHPHDNMEIITIVLRGALEHSDSMGHTEAIQENEVQVMSAGIGVYHSEYNHNKDRDVNLLQIWIFPKKHGVKPRYDQKLFPADERVNKWQALVSPMDNEDAGLKIHQDAWISRSSIDNGKQLQYSLHNKSNGAYLFVIDGSVTVNGQVLNKRDAVGLSETDVVDITAGANSDVLLLEVPMIMA